MKFSVPCLLVALAAVAVLEETAVEALRTVPTSTHRIVASSLAVPRGGDLSSYAAKLEAVKDAVLSSTVASVSLIFGYICSCIFSTWCVLDKGERERERERGIDGGKIAS